MEAKRKELDGVNAVVGAEGPKIVNNTVRGWLGLEEVDLGKKRKQEARSRRARSAGCTRASGYGGW